jgi:hypothetical protein
MHRSLHWSLCLLTLFFSSVIIAQSVENEDSTIYHPRVYFSAGAYFPTVNTKLRLDGDVLGTEISLEDDLKLLEEMEVFKFDGLLRVGQRSQFQVSFTSLLRSQSFVVDETITVNDTTLDVGAAVNLSFDTYYSALTWRYSVFNKKNWNAGFSVGLRYVYFSTKFDALANDRSIEVNEGIGAPAMLVGLHGGAYLTPRLLGRYSFEWIGLTVADISINIVETDVSLEYFIGKNWGAGVAYSTNAYTVRDIPFSDFEGRVIFAFGGANLFLTARF